MGVGTVGPAGRERRAELAEKLRDYHDVRVSEVLDVIGYLRGPGDTVIAGGSLALGLGNRLSDFDIVVCGPDTSPSRVPLEHWVKSLRVDAWTRSQAGIDKLFEHAFAALHDPKPIQGAFGTVEEEQQLKLLHRVAFGLILDGPPLRPAREATHQDIARGLLVREYAERMRESAFVAQLSARSGRAVAATSNARLAVEECLQVLIAATGLPFTGDKWLQERLRSVAPGLKRLHDRFAGLPASAGQAEEYVTDAVALCARLTGLDVTVKALGADLTWSISDVDAYPASGETFLVAADLGGLWRLDPDEVQVWHGLAERGAAGLRGPDCTDAETDLLIRLYERGLATLVWDRGVPADRLADLDDMSRLIREIEGAGPSGSHSGR